MRIVTRDPLYSLAIAGGLLFGSALMAQTPDAQPNAATNAVGSAALEDPSAGSNASISATTNQVDENTRAEQQMRRRLGLATDTNESAAGEKGIGGLKREAMVVFGKDAELKAGDSAEVVVAIGGAARIHGKVHDAVTAIGGDVDVDGDVGRQVVAVLGDVKIRKGATVHGDVVAVGGKVEVAEGATIEGRTQEVDFSAFGLSSPKWLRNWFVHCFLMLRPLAPQVGWVWMIAGACFLFYLLVSVLFPRPVRACVNELTQRPATTFFLGMLTLLLMALVVFFLAVTVVGLLVVPFILAALLLGAVLGKVAVVESLGFKLTRQFGAEDSVKPAVALCLGMLIITVLYLVPILGLMIFCVVGVWGLGAAVTASFGSIRREVPEKAAAPAPSVAEPVLAGCGAGGPSSAGGFSSSANPGGAEFPASGLEQNAPPSQGGSESKPSAASILPETLAYPKASFWERMAAGFLDMVLVSILGGLAHPFAPFVALAYFAGMWAWKSTTIGGIVIGLKVARMDAQPVTFAVALVRALAAAFSIVVLFLGFLWIAWDADKQGWHDKIAGTVVLKLPRGTPLVCL